MGLLVAGTPRAHGEQFPFRDQGVGHGRSRDGGFPGRPNGRVRATRTDGARRGVGRSGHPVLAAIAAGRPATRRLPSTGRVQSLDADNLDHPGPGVILASFGMAGFCRETGAGVATVP